MKERKVFDFKLYRTNGACSSFVASLYNLIERADKNNREKIRLGFPVEVEIFEEWQAAPTEKDFFNKYE